MSRDFLFSILTRSNGKGLADAANDMDRLAARSERAERQMAGLADESGHVDKEILRLKRSISDLGREIDTTGDKRLFRQRDRDQSELRKLERLAKEMGQAGEAAGQNFSSGFGESLKALPAQVKGAGMIAAAALGVSMAPVLGAAVAGAVVGGLGLGGIAGGIAMASRDPQVQSAAQRFGDEVSEEFFSGGAAFVTPIQQALTSLSRTVRDLHLGDALAPLAGELLPLADGLGDFARNVMPGFNAAIRQAGPALQIIADKLPEIGTALGDAIARIAESKGALDGLRMLLDVTGTALQFTGEFVGFLSDEFHGLITVLANVSGAMEDVVGWIPVVGDNMRMSNDQFERWLGIGPKIESAWAPLPGHARDFATAQDSANRTTKTYTQTLEEQAAALEMVKRGLDDAFSSQMNLDQATIAIQADTLALKKAVEEHGTSLATNTDEGLANRRMLLGLVQDYEAQRKAASTSEKATAAATAKFDNQVGTLLALGTKLGFSRKQLHDLLGEYMHLHDAPDINKNVNINYTSSGDVRGGGGRTDLGYGGRAAGGPVLPGVPYVINERGYETVTFPASGTVHPAHLTPAMAASGGREYIELEIVHRWPDGETTRQSLLALKRQRGLATLGF